jgi:hypothetical protein
MKSTGESIYFMDDFNDEHFKKPYEFKNLYLSKLQKSVRYFEFRVLTYKNLEL